METNMTNKNVNLNWGHISLAHEYTVPVKLDEIYKEQLKDPLIKKYQCEAPHSLGKTFDNTGQKTGPTHALTIIDPVYKEHCILVHKVNLDVLFIGIITC